MNEKTDLGKYTKFLPRGYPVKHKRKDPFAPSLRLSSEYKGKINKIRKMDDELGKLILSSKDYIELVADAHASNVHWSTAFEGNPIPFEDVRKSSYRVMNSNDVLKENNPGPSQEILNHLYSFFINDAFTPPWNLEHIKMIHKILMNRTGIDCTPGMFTNVQMYIKDTDGTVTFIGCPPEHIKEELSNLINWMNSSPYDEILTSIVFFHEFESIHPFKDGNGRCGRTLFHILLQELGYKNSKYCIFDSRILMNKSTYYALMEYTDDVNDYTILTEYFIDAIFESYIEALERFKEKDVLKELDNVARNIAVKAREKNNWFTINEATKWSPNMSEQKIRSRIENLVQLNVIEKSGATKGLRYRFVDPFRELRINMNNGR